MKLKLLLALGLAFSAATPSKALAQTPATNWSGFYFGGNAGYGWGAADSSQSGSAASFSGAPTRYVPNSFIAAVSNANGARDGVVGGFQIGYNFASPKWIIGAETDLQFGRRSGSNALFSPLSGTVCNNVNLGTGQCATSAPFPSAVNGPISTALESSIEWFGTVRGRLGYLLSDNLLVFGTGGLAYGRVKASAVTNVAVTVANGLVFAPDGGSDSVAKTNVGFALGAGLEGSLSALATNWTWKIEYLYVDLGSLDTAVPFAMVRTDSPSLYYTPITGTAVTHTRFTDNILRIGLNYRFAP